MPKVLIIGYGNPLRGDDGVGWVIAEKLMELFSDEQVRIRTCIQLTPELAAELNEVEIVIFVDAKCSEPRGNVEFVQVSPSSPSQTFSHHFTPVTLLSYTQQLFGKTPKAFIVSVNGSEFGFQDRLSEPVQNAVPSAVKTVLTLLEKFGIVPNTIG